MPTNTNNTTYTFNEILAENNIVAPTDVDNIVSSELKEFITHKPAWIIRNGILLFLIIILLLISATFFIQYPEVVKGHCELTGSNLPKQVLAKSDGKLITVQAINNQQVAIGQPLAIIESSVNSTHVFSIENWLQQNIDNTEVFNNAIHMPFVYSDLGFLQKNFEDIVTALQQWNMFWGNGYNKIKQSNIFYDLQILEKGKQNAINQSKLIAEDKKLQEQEYAAYEKLATQKVIAPIELNQQKSKVLLKEQQLQQANATILNNTSNYNEKQKQLLEIVKQKSEAKQQLLTAIAAMKAAIADWRERFVITATENGRLQILQTIQNNMNVKQGQELFVIIPQQPTYYAQVFIAQEDFAKVNTNQTVYIKLNSYPFQQYGSIVGTIKTIPELAVQDSVYLLHAAIPTTLKTTYKKTIPFKNNLLGIAEIVTNNQTLANKFFYTLNKLINKR